MTTEARRYLAVPVRILTVLLALVASIVGLLNGLGRLLIILGCFFFEVWPYWIRQSLEYRRAQRQVRLEAKLATLCESCTTRVDNDYIGSTLTIECTCRKLQALKARIDRIDHNLTLSPALPDEMAQAASPGGF